MNQEFNHHETGTILEELKAVNRVIDRICRVRETNHIMSIIIDELVSLTGAGQGVINLIERTPDPDLITVVRKSRATEDDIPYKLANILAGWVIKNKVFLKIDDLDREPRFPNLDSENGRFKSLICFPLVARGETIGILSLIRENARGHFAENHCRLAGIIASQSAQIISNSLLLEDLAHKNELLELGRRKLQDENLRLQSELGATFAFENIIGKSREIKEVMRLCSKVAGNNSPVLITGSTGTGKELVARAIHYNSPRQGRPFLVKNCGIKTESLLEAELFGYTRGAFTGADRDKQGLFKEADGGTIFLDEIGDAPLSTQIALLRVLETGEIRPVGANRTEYVNIRILAATNKDLSEEITKGNFRQDLYYRLNTFHIDLPPLSRRREDIPLLVHHFLGCLKIKLGKDNLTVTPAAMEIFSRYPWPGNVRQLENELERAAVICEAEGQIDVADLSPELVGATPVEPGGEIFKGHLREIVEKVEKDMIASTLKENQGNLLRTSKVLGLTRKGLKDKIARYGLKAKEE